MNDKKTKKYNHHLTEENYVGLRYVKDWCNDVFDTEYDREFGHKDYRKVPYVLKIDRDSSQTHKIIDWLDGLDEEYHNLFGTYGKKIGYDIDTRLPFDEQYKNRSLEGSKWLDYLKKFNRICKEVFHQQKYWYSDEERIVMSFFRGLFYLFINDEWFEYSKINHKSRKEEELFSPFNVLRLQDISKIKERTP